jgi:hypothetical protein
VRRSDFLFASIGGLVAAALAVGGAAALSGRAQSPDLAPSDAVHIARAALPESSRDLHGEPGAELLSLDQRGDGSAQVLLYDYAANRTHQVTVASGAVISDSSGVRSQPPPSTGEAVTAFGLALRSLPTPSFVTTFARQQGVPLVSADQIRLQASSWVAPDAGSADAERLPRRALVCGDHRCLRLVIATAAGDYLNTGDFVVDLSAGRVIRGGHR